METDLYKFVLFKLKELNNGKYIKDITLDWFYNIKQFLLIKIIPADFYNSNLKNCVYIQVLPEDNDGESLLNLTLLYNYIEDELRLTANSYNNLYLNVHLTYKFHCFTKFNLTGYYWEEDNLDYWLVKNNKFRWIKECLKENNPEYNLAMYELYGFNEEYVRKELNYEICRKRNNIFL